MLDVVYEDKEIVKRLPVKVVRIRNNISSENDREFRRLLVKVADEEKSKRWVLDLSLMHFINSSGLGAISMLAMKLKKSGRSLVIVSPNKELTQVFQVTKLDQILTITADEKEAMEILAEE